MKSIATKQFKTQVNYDNGFTSTECGIFDQTMELFSDADILEKPECYLIEWDIPAMEETLHINIVVDDDNNLIDYDGVFELPNEAIELLEANNIKISQEFRQ